ncbi:DDE superfamily endonuclease [Popillia japonica]|uniref:DDE superfamily endonuclease n=1 Tax=Popillia japonica TaxID=7064 RepID=A0AAW1NDY1_POPJA
MNNQRTFIPPFLIFARVLRLELLFKCPPNTYAVAHPSGWMTKDCFTQYLHHFARYAHPSKENPVLVVPSGWMTKDCFTQYLHHFARYAHPSKENPVLVVKDCFTQYLHHFARYAHPSKENPVLVVVDNHTSHISLQSIEFCRENRIIMISLPPHTTHRVL